MAGEENLVSLGDRTTEEQREIARQGGIASGKARRERKQFKETLETLLSMQLNDGEGLAIEGIQAFASLNGQNVSVQEAILIKQVQRALKGDIKSAEYIRDSVGQRPADRLEVREQIENPFEGLTTEELKKLVNDD